MNTKNTDEVVVEKAPHTEESATQTAEQTAEENKFTSDKPLDLKSNEEVLKGLADIANTSDDAKPTRSMRTIQKEARKLESAIQDGIVDYDKLAELVTDTDIGDKALEVFAKKQNLTVEELREEMLETETFSKYDKLKEELDELKAFKEEETSKRETKDFLSFYEQKVKGYDITPSEFDVLYGDKYVEIFTKYVSALGKTEAATLAFEMTIGKDTEHKSKIEEVKQKYRIKNNAVSLKPTEGEQTTSKELLPMAEVNALPQAERIAYKKLHYNPTTKLVSYSK